MIRAERHDAGWIDLVVRDVVVALDMVEVDRPGDTVGLVQVLEIPEEMGIIDDSPNIALEMSVVHDIKPNQRHEQAPVGFDELRPK